MNESAGKLKARNYYDQEAEDYIKQYREGYDRYPQNLIRIKFIIERLKKINVKTVLDAGCGTCGPMMRLIKEGFDVRGFDFSEDMVKMGRKELEEAGHSGDLIHWADLEEGTDLGDNRFDAMLALGVFPHILDEKKALTNMGKMLNPGGSVFIEFRNDLFSAFSMNNYSIDFYLNRCIDLDEVPEDLRKDVTEFYTKRLQVEPPVKDESGQLRYTDILAKYKNPLTIGKELFKPCDFEIEDIHFYHYHALPPAYEKTHTKIFRELSMKMEKTNDWRGYLMASAYVVEAKKRG